MKKTIALVIFIVLFVLTLGTTVFLFFKYSDSNSSIENLNQEMSSLNEKIQELSKNENEISNEEPVIPTEEKKVIIPVFDATKIQNMNVVEAGQEVVLNPDSNGKVSVKLAENGKVIVQVEKNANLPGYMGDYEEHEVQNVGGRAVRVKAFSIGNDGSPQIIMILEDGTVETLNMEKLKQGEYVSAGKAKNMTNVVEVVSVAVASFVNTNEGKVQQGGYPSIAAIREDGTIYLFEDLTYYPYM